MSILDYITLFGSILGIVNSLILIIYSLSSDKGKKQTNLLFAFLVLVLTMRISKSIFLTFSDHIHDILLAIGLAGFLAIGPAFYFYTRSVVEEKYRVHLTNIFHFIPSFLYVLFWSQLEVLRSAELWHIFYRVILFQYMLYVGLAINQTRQVRYLHPFLFRDLSVIALFLMAIWLAYMLNEAAGFPYIAAAILYSLLIYFSIIILVNKGYIFDLSSPKYAKSGLNGSERNLLIRKLEELISDESVITDNTLSLRKLAKLMDSNIHAASQVINEEKQQTFFELISSKRIQLACQQLIEKKAETISNIAYSVGYNSLSAFNTAFKKQIGTTPTEYRKLHE